MGRPQRWQPSGSQRPRAGGLQAPRGPAAWAEGRALASDSRPGCTSCSPSPRVNAHNTHTPHSSHSTAHNARRHKSRMARDTQASSVHAQQAARWKLARQRRSRDVGSGWTYGETHSKPLNCS
eukprot:1113960-Rhodomonas_salina.2